MLSYSENENLNFGARGDWIHTDLPPIIDLSNNLKETLLNYESYGHRHSPVYLIFLSLFKNFSLNFLKPSPSSDSKNILRNGGNSKV